MTARQWLLITGVVILNIIVFGALLGNPASPHRPLPTPTWTRYPTFTPTPFPTPTAILMPTLPPSMRPTVVVPVITPIVHVVRQGETLASIAKRYGVSEYVLRMLNRIPADEDVRPGQQLIIPPIEG